MDLIGLYVLAGVVAIPVMGAIYVYLWLGDRETEKEVSEHRRAAYEAALKERREKLGL